MSIIVSLSMIVRVPNSESEAIDCASPATDRSPLDCCRFLRAGDLRKVTSVVSIVIRDQNIPTGLPLWEKFKPNLPRHKLIGSLSMMVYLS